MTDPNAPAYPLTYKPDGDKWTWDKTRGLTKREAMAMHIMAGMVSSTEVINTPFNKTAQWAVDSADALLAELARTGG